MQALALTALCALTTRFDSVWCVDFEFRAPDGHRPQVLCMVARDLFTGNTLRLWADELRQLQAAPFPTGDRSLVVAYYASAEMGCFLALGWPMPAHVLDLYAEFRNATNGSIAPAGDGLLGALVAYGLDGISVAEKEEIRQLIMRGAPYSPQEQHAILAYCETDVDALGRLLPAMAPRLDLPRALLRGRYMKAAARMEWVGTPIDRELLNNLQANWEYITQHLITEVDKAYGVFDGSSFRQERWMSWCGQRGIEWPLLDSGYPALDADTFEEMALTYPTVQPMYQLRATLGCLREFQLPVGPDSYNRCLLSAFKSKTSRNQPSTSRFIFGLPAWLRTLIRPPVGWGLAYLDYARQEFGIGAALSGDVAMANAYQSGCPYIAFGVLAGILPSWATPKTHPAERDVLKAVVLGVQYAMSEHGLAPRIQRSRMEARELLATHRRVFKQFWQWSDCAVNHAYLFNSIQTAFGWTLRVGADTNPRTVRNFPMQGNGAEILRIACCLLTEQGVPVCAPVHDAVLIMAPLSELMPTVRRGRAIMREASKIVLNGFPLKTDAKIIRSPESYADKRGAEMWRLVNGILRPGSMA